MSLATRELARSKLRFTLLAGAVGLLVFLILFQQALLGGLITQFIGALRNQNATVLVYGSDARKNLEGSRLENATVDQVRAVPGVSDAGRLGQGTFTVLAGRKLEDATLIGYELDRPGQPTTLSSGRLARTDFEAVASQGDSAKGLILGRSVKVAPDGSQLIFCGYIGGTGEDVANAIAVDGLNCVYITGFTFSTETSFPVTFGPVVTQKGLSDAFVAKINNDGQGLAYCGYIGGGASDVGTGIAVDLGFNAYVCGYTNSTETTFPVAVGPTLTYVGGAYDAFVAKR